MVESEKLEGLIQQCLAKGQLTTSELSRQLQNVISDCPDELMRALMKMRRKGIIRGGFSREIGGFVWTKEDGRK
ncbi:MAG: hypothetical protein ABR879_07400 [Methanomassiliicoccales archaeon]|jgi:hypothetical protein